MENNVDRLYDFHKQESKMWEDHLNIKAFIEEIGYEVLDQKNSSLLTKSPYHGDVTFAKQPQGHWYWASSQKNKILPSEAKELCELNQRFVPLVFNGDLITVASQIYIPRHIRLGYYENVDKELDVFTERKMNWYQQVIKVEARNNIRSLIAGVEVAPQFFKSKEPLIDKDIKDDFYTKNAEIYKEVKWHEANLAEGLSFSFGEKPLALTVQEALLMIGDINVQLEKELKQVAKKLNMDDSVVSKMVDVAQANGYPLSWQMPLLCEDPLEYLTKDATKTSRTDLTF